MDRQEGRGPGVIGHFPSTAYLSLFETKLSYEYEPFRPSGS